MGDWACNARVGLERVLDVVEVEAWADDHVDLELAGGSITQPYLFCLCPIVPTLIDHCWF